MAKSTEGMIDVTFVIPVRIDSPARLANLIAVVSYYQRTFQESSFIILEADADSRLKGVFSSDRIKHIFIQDGNKIFHRTKYINRMFKEVSTPIAAVWDTDAVCPEKQIIDAVGMLRRPEAVMVYPYDGIFWSVGMAFSELFRQKLDLGLLTDCPQPRSLMCGYHSVGGAFLVDVEKYRDCGWENEYFEGWGPEDAERYARLEILGYRPDRVEGQLYHLYHPRGINSGMSDSELAKSTKKEYCKVCSMNRDELKDYVKGWPWTRM